MGSYARIGGERENIVGQACAGTMLKIKGYGIKNHTLQ